MMRGCLIQHSARRKKEDTERLELDQDKLEKHYIENRNSNTWNKLNNVSSTIYYRRKLNLHFSAQRYYEQGERAGKVLT